MSSLRPFKTVLSKYRRGSVTVLVLVMLVVAGVLIAAMMSFISQQTNQTVRQEQEEQAFGLADAGVYYTQWLLSEDGHGLTPEELLNNPPASTTQYIEDETGETIGWFSITYSEAGNDYIKLRSVGRDIILTDLCQTVDAELRSNSAGTEYFVAHWDHKVGYPCDPVEPSTDPGPTAACNDGLDNDGDGIVDYPDEPGCLSEADDSEIHPVCSPETQQAAEGQTFSVQASQGPDFEWSWSLSCVDCSFTEAGVEGTMLAPGEDISIVGEAIDAGGQVSSEPAVCVVEYLDAEDGRVPTACSDDFDNDGDGLIDLNDPGCDDIDDNDESNDPSPSPISSPSSSPSSSPISSPSSSPSSSPFISPE